MARIINYGSITSLGEAPTIFEPRVHDLSANHS